MTERFATSLPGFIPSGTVLTLKSAPFSAKKSIFGVFAASSGVLPPSCGSGLSAQPSASTITYFISVSPFVALLYNILPPIARSVNNFLKKHEK